MQSQRKDEDGWIVIEWDVLSGYQWDERLLHSGITVYLSRRLQQRPQSFKWSTDMPSVGPQLQALPCTLVYACRLEQFSIWYGLMAPWPFTDCGLVNLVRALVHAGSGPVSVGQVKA
jgi:hypothetical protein